MIEHQCSFSPKLDDTSRTFVEQLKEDQASAWGVVDRVYTSFIKANLRRFGVSDSDIEDVTQDVLLTAAGCIKRFEFRAQTGSFRSWLKTITRSRAVDHLRKKPPPQHGLPFDPISWVPPLENEEDFGQQLPEIEDLYTRATLELSNYFRPESVDIFLSLVRGTSVAQMAAETGKSEAAIRQTKVRVLQRLREIAGE